MNTDKTTTATARAEQPHFEKRIGKTTYRVKVHFNPNSKETITDKIFRLLRNEAQNPKM
ncbi:MAG: transposon-encoded TnpW family protein [Clostridiales bacterium]|nr:transposon-encoded TnpW family protein [Clostridiales bacterium]